MSRAVVIGGGIAGLSTAALLARDGHEVTLVEQRDALGQVVAGQREKPPSRGSAHCLP